MSDEQPPEMGSRRRRREIREARERERAAQRENESAVRRLSNSSTADTTTSGSRGESSRSDAVFDQETTTPKDQRRGSTSGSAQDFVSRRERRRLQAERMEQAAKAREAQRAKQADEAPQLEADEQITAAPTEEPVTQALSTPSTPFDHVVAPRSAETPDPTQDEHAFADEYVEVDWDTDHGEFEEEGHYEHDHEGAPVYVEASGYGRGYQTVSPTAGEIDPDLLKKRRAKKRRRNVTLTFALLGFGVLMVAFVMIVRSLLGDGGANDYDEMAGDQVEFEILPGDGFTAVQNRLVDQEIIASQEAFQDALADLDEVPTLQPGTVEGMREQMPAADAVAALFPEAANVYYFAIDPNMWIDDALEMIASRTEFSIEELQELNNDPQQFGLPEQAENLEGYLPPGEYEYSLEDEPTAEEVIQDMVDVTFERLDELDIDDPDDQYDTVIIASLITAEANHQAPEQYPDMSSAIHNRLSPDNDQTDGMLQIDATANYSMGIHDLQAAATADENDPYNTATHVGLPPGPIGAPLQATLEAAANPSDTNYYYWVTVNIETGETQFSETYEEHQEGVELFTQWCDDNPGVCSPSEVDAAEDELDE